MTKIGAFTVDDAKTIAETTKRLKDQPPATWQTGKQFGGLRRPRVGGGGGLSCHFTLTAQLNDTDATGTCQVNSCPERPSLEGTTVTLTNMPADHPASAWGFFGEIGTGGVGAYNATDETVWIQNLFCEVSYSTPEEVTGATNAATTFGFYYG